jgi:hypothetical protein
LSMRVLVCGCLVLFASAGATAQRVQSPRPSPIQKGSIQIGGTASLVHEHDVGNGDDFDWTLLQVFPRVGYFVARGLEVNANLRYQKGWAKYNNSTEWGVGPGLTYYIATRSRRIFPFVSARTLFVHSKSRSDERLITQPIPTTLPASEFKSYQRDLLGSAGLLYMLAKQVGISGELFYQREYVTDRFDNGQHDGNSFDLYGAQWGVAVFLF